jgi:two-component system cell cycle sensor histidine kinase/response regulator CckA
VDGSPNARRQAEIGLALSFVWIPLTLVRAVLFWIRGPAVQAAIGFTAVGLGCVLPLVLKRTRSLRFFGNGIAFLWFASLSSLTYLRGGIGSPALIGLGFVPLGAIFIGGVRSGAFWTGLVIAEVVVYLALEGAGFEFHDQFSSGSRTTLEGVGAICFVLGVFAIGVAYEGTAGAALQALDRAERSSRALLDAMPDLGFRVRRDGVCLERHGKSNAFPLLSSELVGRRLGDVIPELDAILDANIQKSLEGASVVGAECSLTLGGETREYEMRFVPAGQDEVLIVARDLTDLKILARRLSRAEEEAKLLRADRMASVGQLAAAVAHEANNPLAYVIANLAFVKERLGELRSGDLTEARSALTEALTEGLQGAERVRQIVRDLKTFARADEQEQKPIDLAAVLDTTLKMAGTEIRHRARLVKAYEAASPVMGNESRLAQVFLNVLVNAAQSIPPGRADANEIKVSVGPSETGGAKVEISDTGTGISPVHLPRVTEPFFTTKPIGEGTGLGLTVCQNIVTDYGGRLVIESALGRGTTVRIELPAAPEGSLVAKGSDAAPVRKSGPALRVLAIDDDPLVLKAIKRVLRAYELTATNSGREACELVAGGSHEFDVILCDLMMPDLTGIDVYERIRGQGRGLEKKMVFLTGGAFTSESQAFLASVPNLRVDKPFSPDGLERALHRGAANAS